MAINNLPARQSTEEGAVRRSIRGRQLRLLDLLPEFGDSEELRNSEELFSARIESLRVSSDVSGTEDEQKREEAMLVQAITWIRPAE